MDTATRLQLLGPGMAGMAGKALAARATMDAPPMAQAGQPTQTGPTMTQSQFANSTRASTAQLAARQRKLAQLLREREAALAPPPTY
jgi:hypothetical protein